MTKYALIGEKLGHSYSKIIHRMYFEICKINAEYSLIEYTRDALPNCCDNMRQDGFSGFNITIPYKQDIMKLLDGISEEAEKIGAVNTVKLSKDKALGYNTDYYGLIKTFEKFEIQIPDKRVVILGTGGACKAVCAVCRDLRAKEIVLVSRNPQKCKDFETVSYNEKIYGDVLINTTPVGMFPNGGFSPVNTIDNGFEAVFDLIYNPSKTALMQIAEENGIKAVNGLYMLVAQAMRSEEIWSGENIGEEITDRIYTDLQIKSEKGELK